MNSNKLCYNTIISVIYAGGMFKGVFKFNIKYKSDLFNSTPYLMATLLAHRLDGCG